MERQPRRVRLTDQALVAVAIARAVAAPRPVTVAHLVAGLAAEPDGVAGRMLRDPEAAAVALMERAGASSGRLPPLEVALRWAEPEDPEVPLWTPLVLRAALEVGSTDLADLLASCGLDARPLLSVLTGREWRDGARWVTAAWLVRSDDPAGDPETVGAPALGEQADALTPAAALAVARARALRGRATDLALVLPAAEEPGWPDPFGLVALRTVREAEPSPARIEDVLRRLDPEGPPTSCGDLALAVVAALAGPRLRR